MAFYSIQSTNPNLSYILEKNPASGLQVKANKKGVFFYWFSKEGIFNVYFKDVSDEMSYPQNKFSQFEYLNASHYNDARCLLDLCQELLHSAREKDSEYDSTEFEYKFFINLIETQYKTLDIFEKYFSKKGFEFEHQLVAKDNYQVTITTTNKTLRETISLVNLFAMFATLNSPDFYYLHPGLTAKYLKLANFLDVPYFIKYLIKIRMIRSIEQFLPLKAALNQSNSFDFNFEYGDTHDMRIKFIKNRINADKPIIDIGAGDDFRYLKVLGTKLQDNGHLYYAIDQDEEARFKISRGVKNKGFYNTSVHSSIDEVIELLKTKSNQEVDILCTEVLEHNEIEEAKEIINKILNSFNISQLIITVPNVDFNKHYAIDRLRHEDHKWEISFDEFKSLVLNCLTNYSDKYKVEFAQIGDCVDNDQITSCAIITKK